MTNKSSVKLTLTDDLRKLKSLVSSNGERELLSSEQGALFLLRARTKTGDAVLFSPEEAEVSKVNEKIAYRFSELTVFLTLKEESSKITWSFTIENNSELAVEFLDLPNVKFGGKLRENGGDCAIVSGYNEGLLTENSELKKDMLDPEFPSLGCYMMYPYMVSVPIMMWLYGNEGILMAVKDRNQSPKGLDFQCSEEHTEFRTRLFLGGNYGESIENGIEIEWEHFDGDWQVGAEIYREYVNTHTDLKPISEAKLPEWYTDDMPLVLTYPVRGIHDMDEMTPNKLFPYGNVLPLVDEFAEKTGEKIMILLMHWEGTAPWAPPYVYPPFGGEDMFKEFMNSLHERGDLLGVYCSGYGMTEQSNLIESYNLEDKIINEKLTEGFCRAPDQSIVHSCICTGQRSGYDICAASKVGKQILDDALTPLLQSGVDYVQALDQNHGGGMYFCYANDHGHAPVPGSWIVDSSKKLLQGWRELAPNTLLGCESAAAEPYINELRLSDNRYELCYGFGKAIPLYAFLYHRYLHNFMGNQVSSPIENTTRGLIYRVAYSFLAGDLITLVLNDDGQIMFNWGMRDFSRNPDRDTVIAFCAELHKWHKKYPKLFKDADMAIPFEYECDQVVMDTVMGHKVNERAVLSTAWKLDGHTVQLFVNYTDKPQDIVVKISDNEVKRLTVPAFGAVDIEV